MPTITAAHTAYNDISGTQIDKDSTKTISDATLTAVKNYETELVGNMDVSKSLLDEVDANLNYTMMAMCIWIPLGAIAGYYLYKRNFGVPTGVPQ